MNFSAPNNTGKNASQILSDYENSHEYKTTISDPIRGNKTYTKRCGRKEIAVLDRLWNFTQVVEHPNFTNPCLLFRGIDCIKNYQQIWYHGKYVRVHRLALILNGIILTKDMHIDHLCERKNCWEVSHLEETTPGENTRRYHNGRG
jgi:hypothetical protein